MDGPPSRIDPPLAASEAETLQAYLDYHRETLRWKTAGLDAAGLGHRHPPSTLTLGGLLKHLALVEVSWFRRVMLGEPLGEPWDSVDWDADPDWEWRTGVEDDPDDVRALYEREVFRAQAAIDQVRAGPDGLGTLSVKPSRHSGDHFTLRWVMLHMVEEYARHNGHADLLREAVDGEVGE